MKKYSQIVLIILDGWGLSPSWGGNAISMNKPVNFDRLWREHPHMILQALGAIEYGNVVGESRLGHLMIGAGRPVSGNHSRINKLIKNKTFFNNSVLKSAFSYAKKHHSNVHLIGMISDGGVHADIEHLNALLEFAHRENFDKVFIDAISDGIDSGEQDALKIIEKIQKKIRELKVGKFNTLCGREIAMDRDEHWDKTRRYFDLLTKLEGDKFETIEETVSASYRIGKNDENINPSLIGDAKKISENDAVIFFNFREDRSKQVVRVFSKNFRQFLWKPKIPKNLFLCSFTKYDKNLDAKIAFPESEYKNNLSEYLASLDYHQLKVAESEKSAHITSFFNGNHLDQYRGEERKIISSPDIASYELTPEMSARLITKTICKAVEGKKYDIIIANYANVDMLAHTGNIIAAGKAIQILDEEIKKVVDKTLEVNGAVIITADHGNAEQMINLNKRVSERETIHTLNPVPFIYINRDNKKNLLKMTLSYPPNSLTKIIQAKETLADVAPTILEILDLQKPREMTGHSLLEKLE